jgi:hypothetical protein
MRINPVGSTKFIKALASPPVRAANATQTSTQTSATVNDSAIYSSLNGEVDIID